MLKYVRIRFVASTWPFWSIWYHGLDDSNGPLPVQPAQEAGRHPRAVAVNDLERSAAQSVVVCRRQEPLIDGKEGQGGGPRVIVGGGAVLAFFSSSSSRPAYAQ
jgi:hypothetical protein